MYSNILSATNKLFSYFLFVDGFLFVCCIYKCLSVMGQKKC